MWFNFSLIKAKAIFNNKNKKGDGVREMVFVLSLCFILLCGCSSDSITNNVIGTRVVSQREREERIEDVLEEIEGISSSVVVIRGRAALIGIVIERGYEHTVNDIKNMASSVARVTDKNVKSTAVTCNKDITEMIKNLKELDR